MKFFVLTVFVWMFALLGAVWLNTHGQLTMAWGWACLIATAITAALMIFGKKQP
jgi:hypothetical protein